MGLSLQWLLGQATGEGGGKCLLVAAFYDAFHSPKPEVFGEVAIFRDLLLKSSYVVALLIDGKSLHFDRVLDYNFRLFGKGFGCGG